MAAEGAAADRRIPQRFRARTFAWQGLCSGDHACNYFGADLLSGGGCGRGRARSGKGVIGSICAIGPAAGIQEDFINQGEVMFKQLFSAALLTGVLFVSGCASVPMAAQGADTQAKSFAPSADKATVYIYRNENFGAAIKMPVLIDNVSVGDTAAKTYIEKQLDPGAHTITSKTEKDSSVSIDMLAGQIYYVWQEVKMGMFAAGSALHVVDARKGQDGVRESKLVQ